MDRLTEIQLRLRNVGCPRCYHTEFNVMLQPGEAGEKPTYRAACGNCGYSFEVDDHEPKWESIEERTHKHLRREGCPRCGSHRINLNFRCTLESRECFHVATCENCGASFIVEKYAKGEKPPLLDR